MTGYLEQWVVHVDDADRDSSRNTKKYCCPESVYMHASVQIPKCYFVRHKVFVHFQDTSTFLCAVLDFFPLFFLEVVVFLRSFLSK